MANMKDFDGNELKVGDKVAFPEPHYRHMVKGTVTGFTAKMIRIDWGKNKWTGMPETCMRYPEYVSLLPFCTAIKVIDSVNAEMNQVIWNV